MDMQEKLQKIKVDALGEIRQANSSAQLAEIHTKFLGRKSELNSILRKLKDMAPEERAMVGKLANLQQKSLQEAFDRAEEAMLAKELTAKIKDESLDVTLPGIGITSGKLHPTTQELTIIENIFQRMGFNVYEPYLIDDDFHNFESLNIPANHPARDMWDTIRVSDDLALIPHTSSMQNRIISSHEPPIRAIVPGKCFRNEATDARHEHSFFQVEGIYVDRGIRLSDMFGTLSEFLKQYFGYSAELKIQPTFFPFVEPGLEIMMRCPVCKGKKKECAGCSGSGWMEIIPCGPIHPNVIKDAGLDPNVYTGFAWGFGLDRLIMVKYGINDVRYFHSGKLDFINQF